jgi:regulation of enolase protein 1 (concanavalin A-like superfamily)
MWGPANNASNILVRPMPFPESGSLQISVTVSNSPTEQYEQVDLVWYYDDSRTVKLGLELVDGRLCIVMGREEGGKTRTIAIIPIAVGEVDLRIAVWTAGIRGFPRPADTKEWKLAGECDLPGRTEPKVSLQLYQGPGRAEHRARIREFQIEQLSESIR